MEFEFYSDQGISTGAATVFDLPENTTEPDGPPYEDDFDPETGVITNTKPLSGDLLDDADDGNVWLKGKIDELQVLTTLVLNSVSNPTSVTAFVGTGPAGVSIDITGGLAGGYFQQAALGANYSDPIIRFNFNTIPTPMLTNPVDTAPLAERVVMDDGVPYNEFDFRDSPDFQGFAVVPEATSLMYVAPLLFGMVGYHLRRRIGK
jgi:hypothetical protein